MRVNPELTEGARGRGGPSDHRADVCVGEEDALRVAGRARGVHEHGEILSKKREYTVLDTRAGRGIPKMPVDRRRETR